MTAPDVAYIAEMIAKGDRLEVEQRPERERLAAQARSKITDELKDRMARFLLQVEQVRDQAAAVVEEAIQLDKELFRLTRPESDAVEWDAVTFVEPTDYWKGRKVIDAGGHLTRFL